jgi:GTP 3',8-cyclase
MSAEGPVRTLRDALGRDLHYLRLSVTDRCNFKCVYCLPNGCPRGSGEEPLSLAEIDHLVRGFAALGFWKVRLTGGEPTLRPDIVEIVRRIARTPGIRRVGLTTNGYRLDSLAGALKDAGLTSLNVSVDSLDPERFREITGTDRLQRVVAGVEEALTAGIPSVKVNAVLLRGMEDAELLRFLSWTEWTPLTVRFIELMQTGDNAVLFGRARLPASEVREKLERLGFRKLPRDAGDGPATNYGRRGHAGRVGLISAYADGFCDSCNRLRVSSVGDLKLCLFGDGKLSLRPLLREGRREALMDLVEAAVTRKPARHELGAGRCGPTANLAMTGG